jgi:hypothetical protein
MIKTSINLIIKALAESGPFFPAPDAQNWNTFLESEVPAFYEMFPTCPVPVMGGGCTFHSALMIYLASRWMKPDLIIESGSYRGVSAWVFRTACPKAEIHCFDISFAHLAYKHPSIHYHEHDWTAQPLNFEIPEKSVCYFDDHINQADRVLESHRRGLHRLIFDDNVPTHALHKDGLPPVPTIDMLFDDSLKSGDVLEWVSAATRYRYEHDADLVSAARKLITSVNKPPRIQYATGYPMETDTTFVCLA